MSSVTFAMEEQKPPYFNKEGTHVRFLCFGERECDVVSIPEVFLQNGMKDSMLARMVADDLNGKFSAKTLM